MNPRANFGTPLKFQGATATIGLICALGAAFVASWVGMRHTLVPLLGLNPGSWFSSPWTLLTYPFASPGNGADLFWFLIMLYWLYMVGSQTERDLGVGKFLTVWGVSSVLAALFLWLGVKLVGGGGGSELGPLIFGPSLPVAAMTVIWAVRNQGAQVSLMFVLPIKAIVLAYVTVALVVFGYGTGQPVLGLFAAAHLGVAWMFALGRIPFAPYASGYRIRGRTVDKPAKRMEEKRLRHLDNAMSRQKDRAERERLRKLFEGSLREDERSDK